MSSRSVLHGFGNIFDQTAEPDYWHWVHIGELVKRLHIGELVKAVMFHQKNDLRDVVIEISLFIILMVIHHRYMLKGDEWL